MDNILILPPIMAMLNVIAACTVTLGYLQIRKRNRTVHRNLMLGALAVSTLFFVIYLYYHGQVGYIPFKGRGFIRPVYFTLLASHVILAALMVPLVLTTAGLAIRGRFTWHKRLARWTLPVWLYVSITGVVIYVLSFHIYTA